MVFVSTMQMYIGIIMIIPLYSQRSTLLYLHILIILDCFIFGPYMTFISPREVFSDIMVLALPPPLPPVDSDNVNALN